MKIRQHELGVGSSLQNSNNGAGRISRQEINISRVLSCDAAGFLICWTYRCGGSYFGNVFRQAQLRKLYS